jgi:hypothetical protein
MQLERRPVLRSQVMLGRIRAMLSCLTRTFPVHESTLFANATSGIQLGVGTRAAVNETTRLQQRNYRDGCRPQGSLSWAAAKTTCEQRPRLRRLIKLPSSCRSRLSLGALFLDGGSVWVLRLGQGRQRCESRGGDALCEGVASKRRDSDSWIKGTKGTC